MGRKSAPRREILWILRGFPRASKLLICGLLQKGRVLAQDGILDADIRGFFDAIDHGWLMKVVEHRTLHPYPEQRLRVMT